MKHIYFTVTNDLVFDQRMHRICTSLTRAGYQVTLVGRKLKTSRRLQKKTYRQKRLRCYFNKGFWFYAEFNIRLFLYLIRRPKDAICAIDLDTILPCLLVSMFQRVPRIYDAHEFFTELKEVRTRPFVHSIWKAIARFAIPKFRLGYTVSSGLVSAFHKHYGVDYQLIRNFPELQQGNGAAKKAPILVYQGAVNEGRGFEVLIPAMRQIHCPLVICGDGNYMPRLERQIKKYRLHSKVEAMGMLFPEDLRRIAQEATLGIGLSEREGLNQYWALPNKFMDYIHAGLPQVAMDFPEYRKINEEFEVAVLLDKLDTATLSTTVNNLLDDAPRLEAMRQACFRAREIYNWQNEEKTLIAFYQQIPGLG